MLMAVSVESSTISWITDRTRRFLSSNGQCWLCQRAARCLPNQRSWQRCLSKGAASGSSSAARSTRAFSNASSLPFERFSSSAATRRLRASTCS